MSSFCLFGSSAAPLGAYGRNQKKTKAETSLMLLLRRATAATGVIPRAPLPREHLSSRRRNTHKHAHTHTHTSATTQREEPQATGFTETQTVHRTEEAERVQGEKPRTHSGSGLRSELRRPAIDTDCVSGVARYGRIPLNNQRVDVAFTHTGWIGDNPTITMMILVIITVIILLPILIIMMILIEILVITIISPINILFVVIQYKTVYLIS